MFITSDHCFHTSESFLETFTSKLLIAAVQDRPDSTVIVQSPAFTPGMMRGPKMRSYDISWRQFQLSCEAFAWVYLTFGHSSPWAGVMIRSALLMAAGLLRIISQFFFHTPLSLLWDCINMFLSQNAFVRDFKEYWVTTCMHQECI